MIIGMVVLFEDDKRTIDICTHLLVNRRERFARGIEWPP